VAGERTARVWACVAAARDGDAPVSLAVLCRAAAGCLGVDGASVTAVGGPVVGGPVVGGTVVGGTAVREPLSASDALSARLEELLLMTGEGPGAEDFMFGAPMLIPDLEPTTERWPGFAPAAVAAGARALFAFPLQAGAIRAGVLSLYRARPGPLTPQQLADALVFADIALHLLLDSSAGISGSADYQPLDGLSESRAEVYQATGMISVQLGVSLEEAFVRLRAHAFAAGTPLGDIAGDVVNRLLRFTPDPGP
jgi:ANTAR domain